MNWALFLNPQVWGALLLAILLSSGAAYVKGRLDGGLEGEAQVARLERDQARLNQAHAEGKARLAAANAAKDHEAQLAATEHQRELEREREAGRLRLKKLKEGLTANVTPEADRRCIVSRGFVRQHDASLPGSAAEAVPAASGGSVDEDSGVPLSGVADVVTENYAACGDCCSAAAKWRAWYVKQLELWSAPAPASSP